MGLVRQRFCQQLRLSTRLHQLRARQRQRMDRTGRDGHRRRDQRQQDDLLAAEAHGRGLRNAPDAAVKNRERPRAFLQPNSGRSVRKAVLARFRPPAWSLLFVRAARANGRPKEVMP